MFVWKKADRWGAGVIWLPHCVLTIALRNKQGYDMLIRGERFIHPLICYTSL